MTRTEDSYDSSPPCCRIGAAHVRWLMSLQPTYRWVWGERIKEIFMKWSMKRIQTIVVDNGEVTQHWFVWFFSRRSVKSSRKRCTSLLQHGSLFDQRGSQMSEELKKWERRWRRCPLFDKSHMHLRQAVGNHFFVAFHIQEDSAMRMVRVVMIMIGSMFACNDQTHRCQDGDVNAVSTDDAKQATTAGKILPKRGRLTKRLESTSKRKPRNDCHRRPTMSAQTLNSNNKY